MKHVAEVPMRRIMISSKYPAVPKASAWQLEFARLIAFPAASQLVTEQEWWRELNADLPDDFASTRTPRYRDDRGSFDGVLLSLTVDTSRVVWEVKPAAIIEESGIFATLGPFREKLGWFVDLLSSWLVSSCPPVVRLGLSAKLLQTAATAEDAYRVLAAHLPTISLDSKPDDFVLQINRRKKTSNVMAGLPINRVCTWSKMNMPILVESGKTFTWPEQCYSALELDINTAPEKTDILPSASLPRLFSELVSLGSEIAERGDNP
jgi:hypothetical protein